MKKNDVDVDPRIKIRVVPDGEIHIYFTWTKDDLAQMAIAFLAVSDGRMKADDVVMALRMRDKEGVDYLIKELQKARKELFGDETGTNS